MTQHSLFPVRIRQGYGLCVLPAILLVCFLCTPLSAQDLDGERASAHLLGQIKDAFRDADEQGSMLRKTGEKLIGQVNGGVRYGDWAAADFSIGANFLGDRKCVLE